MRMLSKAIAESFTQEPIRLTPKPLFTLPTPEAYLCTADVEKAILPIEGITLSAVYVNI